ncbi:putative bifunctional diguanylate cyclase/phosphodiesterase [Ferrimonas balearica]|uniref:putative bifunctional diguanylate cyclase/phosphodiesterase n=1 Tax=Ferrimonas balearica TaxID=44012 RepID=UPI001C997422|nr:EAL domain-containing protein [Ferrimonas balearica]MBY5923380.1 EAL domain-containing protein [Ferrimonas balearica]MBY5995130.1 EAL domain-containing protein [Ferrimonas balearica]
MPLFRRPNSQHAFLFGGLLLISYLVLLLLVAHEGQTRLRAHQDNEVSLRVNNYARDLQYFFDNSEAELTSLAEDKTVYTFFANRALGMSMAYGLGASLHKLSTMLEQCQDDYLKEGEPVFKRLILLDLNGRVIADTDPTQPQFSQLPLEEMRLEPGLPRLLTTVRGGKLSILQLVSVLRHDQPQATLLAELNPEQIRRLLASQEHDFQASRLELMTPKGPMIAWNTFGELDFLESNNLYQHIPVLHTPFEIRGWFQPMSNRDLFTSRWFIAGISLLAIPVMVGFFFLLRINNNNLVLQTKVSFSKQQQQRLSLQNERLHQEVARRQESEQMLAYQASHDTLTGLANRLAGQQALERAIQQAESVQGQVLLMFIDLDNFKHINDTQGHHCGDQLLVHSAQRLNLAVGEEDVVARFGGDEFLLILSHTGDRDEARRRAQTLLRLFDSPFNVEGETFYVSTSIGMALYPDDGADAEQLIQRADAALYRVKEKGRNDFSFYDEGINQMVQRRMQLDAKLREAIECNRLEVHYQPVLDLAQSRIVGAEALVRWTDPKLGPISPAEFIPLAERNGLIHRIFEQVLSTASEHASRWQQLTPLAMAVNVSSAQFHQGKALQESIQRALSRSGLPPEQLVVEVTESLMLDNHKDLHSKLHALVDMGVRLAIDDFGTGYSALSYLQQFPFSELKIDRSFLKKLNTEDSDRCLVEAILAMAKAMGLNVVAEGIECLEQARFLKDHGCQLGQGFHYSPALPAEAFEKLLRADLAGTAPWSVGQSECAMPFAQ